MPGTNDSPTASVGSANIPKTPSSGGGKRVGFARPKRPTLIIPPPQGYFVGPKSNAATANITTANLTVPNTANLTVPSTGRTPSNPHMYGRKASVFMFDHFNGLRNFTLNTARSGLGKGEKSAYWLYSKVRRWSRKWFTHIFLSVMLLLYTVGGALLFEYFEAKQEKVVHVDTRKEMYSLIRTLYNMSIVLPTKTSMEEFEGKAYMKVEEFKTKMVEAHETNKLLSAYPGGNIWTFENAVVYCATIYTTIGYGHIYPTTFTGRILTIVYSIIGIPLFLIILTDFGKLFTRCIKFLWSFVRRVYYTGSCRRARKTAHVKEIFKGAQMMYEIATFRRPSMFQDPENPPTATTDQTFGDDTPTTPAISNFEIDDEFNLPISLAIFILLLYIFIGAAVYSIVAQWDFFSAFYFVFISMSTIGFGDVVPSNPIIMIVSIVYLVFGLALMSMCINVVQDKLSDTFKQASAKIGATIGLRVTEDDGSITTVAPEPIEVPQVHNHPSKEDTDTVKEEKVEGNSEIEIKKDS